MIQKLVKAITCYAIFFLFSLAANPAQAIPLSPQARISLITVAPGAELYSMYGHSAIRIFDPVQGLDIVFNYGTFDFRTPNFYVKFVRGKLPYQLAPGYYQDLLQASKADNRSVYEQVLNLTPAETQQVSDFLDRNYLPENRSYLYDFFYDNCATRIRDVFANIIKRNIIFPKSAEEDLPTFRQLVGIYQAPHPWVDFGVDLVMGLPADKEASLYEQMFLPDYLMSGFAKTKIQRGNTLVPFVTTGRQVFKAPGLPIEPNYFTPTIIFWVLFVVVAIITFMQIRKKQASHGLDILLFSLAGLLGFVLLFLWFGTDHQAFKYNLNLLWAFPFHLPMVFLLFRKTKPAYVKIYFFVVAVALLLLAISFKFFPQEFHPAVFPILLMLVLRARYIALTDYRPRRNVNPYR